MCCSGLWEKWQDAGATVGAAAEAEEYDAFIDSLLQRPDSAQKPEAPAAEPAAPAPEDLPGRKRAARAPSPMVRSRHVAIPPHILPHKSYQSARYTIDRNLPQCLFRVLVRKRGAAAQRGQSFATCNASGLELIPEPLPTSMVKEGLLQELCTFQRCCCLVLAVAIACVSGGGFRVEKWGVSLLSELKPDWLRSE